MFILRTSFNFLKYIACTFYIFKSSQGRMSVETEVAIENLVQRIVDGAGQRDPRFRCCHLIALHRDKKVSNHQNVTQDNIG